MLRRPKLLLLLLHQPQQQHLWQQLLLRSGLVVAVVVQAVVAVLEEARERKQQQHVLPVLHVSRPHVSRPRHASRVASRVGSKVERNNPQIKASEGHQGWLLSVLRSSVQMWLSRHGTVNSMTWTFTFTFTVLFSTLQHIVMRCMCGLSCIHNHIPHTQCLLCVQQHHWCMTPQQQVVRQVPTSDRQARRTAGTRVWCQRRHHLCQPHSGTVQW